MNDPGLMLVESLARTLDLAPERLVRAPRELLWWGGGLAQRIVADPPLPAGELTIGRVRVTTDLLRGFQPHREALDELAISLEDLALCGPIQGDDPQRAQLQLACHLYASDADPEGPGRLLTFAVSLQAGAAHRIAAELALLTGATPDITTPASGRPLPDDESLVGLEETVIRPIGQEPSRFTDALLAQLAHGLLRVQLQLQPKEQEGIFTCHLPWGESDQPALLVIENARPHPFLGQGATVWLLLPPEATPEPTMALALALNTAEQRGDTGAHGFGSWCVHREQLAYQVFLPNACFAPDVIEPVVISQLVRARWAAEFIAAAFEE